MSSMPELRNIDIWAAFDIGDAGSTCSEPPSEPAAVVVLMRFNK